MRIKLMILAFLVISTMGVPLAVKAETSYSTKGDLFHEFHRAFFKQD